MPQYGACGARVRKRGGVSKECRHAARKSEAHLDLVLVLPLALLRREAGQEVTRQPNRSVPRKELKVGALRRSEQVDVFGECVLNRAGGGEKSLIIAAGALESEGG